MTDDAMMAEWQSHQVRFRYAGFTTAYTCDGIERKVKQLLIAFGARDDAKVDAPCYGDPFRAWTMYQMVVGFAVAVPVDESEGAPMDAFPAAWQDVEIRNRRPRNFDGGDCELVEQFVDQLASYFAPRDLDDRTRCIPKRRTLGSPRVTAQVIQALDVPEDQRAVGQ